MRIHYSQRFEKYGATAEGVDWGKEADMQLRYKKMLAVILDEDNDSIYDSYKSIKQNGDIHLSNSPLKYKILDVGCGYGGLYQYANSCGIYLDYTGIDLCEEMVKYGRNSFPEATFICQDIMNFDESINRNFDYVVCNGILTQKLTASIIDMDLFTRHLIRKMFDLCVKGVVFNVMTTKVNFMVQNLYYKSPLEMLNFCMDEISTKVRLDHAYPLYEYTIYLYK